MQVWDIGNFAFEVLGYPVSYIELVGTLFGIISVYYASRANILTWPTGIVNEFCLFFLFFQVQLYADMFLQVYFFIVTIYGWKNWQKPANTNSVAALSNGNRLWILAAVVFGSVLSGYLFSNIHFYLPSYFSVEAAFPYIDSWVMVMSIVATVLLAKKKIESWILWITVDITCVGLYYVKGIYFLSLEYLLFLGLASYGLYHWQKQLRHG